MLNISEMPKDTAIIIIIIIISKTDNVYGAVMVKSLREFTRFI